MCGIKISVIVPVYNVERWLSKCLDSILAQTFQTFEIICVNDASYDSSQEILEQYSTSDPRIKVICHPSNEGLMMTRKHGYEIAEGDYLLFCDSDDFLPKNSLAALYDEALRSGADIVAGDLSLYLDGKSGAVRSRDNIGENWNTFLKAILSGTTCSLCGALFSRTLFENVSYQTFSHCNYSEDRILLTQILLKKRPSVVALPLVTYYYRINPASLTRMRLSDLAINSQLEALFWNYEYVNGSDMSFSNLNERFIMRVLSYYIENGYRVELVTGFNNFTRKMLDRKEMFRILGYRLGWHTYLCVKSNGYRNLAHSCRKVIRKLQRKD